MSRSTIPLASVVAFLRRHNALQVLEGAPLVYADDDTPLTVCNEDAINATDEGEADGEGYGLYLGTENVCPAALGWAAHVLSRTQRRLLPDRPHSLGPGLFPDAVAIWEVGRSTGSKERPEADYNWVWMNDWRTPDRWLDGRGINLPGPAPSTPAERLAAVLRYELEREAERLDRKQGGRTT